MGVKRNKIELAIFTITVIATVLLAGAAPASTAHPDLGSNRLVSIQQLPDTAMCSSDLTAADVWAIQQLSPPIQPAVQMAALAKPEPQQNRPAGGAPTKGARTLQPQRTIRDADPTYSAIGLDLAHDEIILQDNNLWSTRVFKRTDNTPVGQKKGHPAESWISIRFTKRSSSPPQQATRL